VKSSDDDFVNEVLHEAILRYHERTTPEVKENLTANGHTNFYIYRIICSVFYDRFRTNVQLVELSGIEPIVEDERTVGICADDVYALLDALEGQSKEGFYQANLFRQYIKCNYNRTQLHRLTGISLETLHKDIKMINNYLKIKLCRKKELQSLAD